MIRRIAAFGLICTCAAPALAADPDSFAEAFWQYTARTGFDYSVGHYGADQETTILAVPVSLRAAKGPWQFRAEFAWLDVTGPALLLDTGAAGAVTTTLGTRRAGSASGPGDVNLYATYSLESLYDQNLFIDFTARLKVPTASFSEGLGTGEPDEAAYVDVSKLWGKFMPFFRFGYRINGSPQGYNLTDVIFGEAGLQYNWTAKLTAGVIYDVRQAALRGEYTPEEGTAYVNYKFNGRWSLLVYGVKGFSRNSPAAGGGATVQLRWP